MTNREDRVRVGRASYTRRQFLMGTAAVTSVAVLGAYASDAVLDRERARAPGGVTSGRVLGPEPVPLVLRVNGERRALELEPRVTLLDALREGLGLTGTKKGCDQGACGACTVLVDGRRINSCVGLAVRYAGPEITTIEGLARGDELHPMQASFIANDAFQCGYCTPGQILSAVALIEEGRAGSDEEIREWMSGNICRCAAYPGIVAAIRDVARGVATARTAALPQTGGPAVARPPEIVRRGAQS